LENTNLDELFINVDGITVFITGITRSFGREAARLLHRFI
jgi:hypothetical protein